MSDQWIVIPGWDPNEDNHESFQHYSDRDPKWIKVYRSLLSKDEYITMSFHLRGILQSLWLEYAASNRQLRDSTLTLTRRLGQRVTRRDLESLNHAGFIVFSASAPIAPCYPRREKIKRKKDLVSDTSATPETQLPPSPAETFARAVAVDPKGREHRPYSPPRDPLGSVRMQIVRGVITDEVTLTAELRAHPSITQADRESLRELLTVKASAA